MTAQEKTKLTLRLNKRLIEQAKAYAAKHNLSVSEMVETYFLNLKETETRSARLYFLAIPTRSSVAAPRNRCFLVNSRKHGD